MSHPYYTVIQDEVQQLAEERDLETHRAFAVWAVQFFHEIDSDDAYDQSDTIANGDGGIDAWHREADAPIFYLWQCKWTTDPSRTFDHSPGTALLSAFDNLLDPAIAKTVGPKFKKLAAEVTHAIDHGYEIRLVVAVPTQFSARAKELLFARAERYGSAQDKPAVHFDLLSAADFEEVDLERQDIANDLSGTKVTIDLHGNETILLDPPSVPPSWKAAVVSLGGESLARVATIYGRRLFHLNVRFALSHRQQRIKSIWNTLESPDTAQFFWFYNNGLTILCNDFEIDGKQVSITNPQVVNGCQTVNAFKAMYPAFGQSASVLARIIQLPNDVGERDKQAFRISRWTNSQVPVLGRDLHTNDRIQRTIKNRLHNFTPRWFYEVKRGEWNSLSPSQRRVYNNQRRVGMDRIGQCYRMTTEPAEALTKKRDLFESQEVYDRVFRDRVAEEYLFPYLCWQYYWEFWHAKQFEAIREVCTEDFDDAQLRRLMRAKGQVVAHSVGLSRWLFQTGETWTAADAGDAYQTFAVENPLISEWTRHVGIAFHGMLEFLESVNEGRRTQGLDEVGLKKHLERSGQRTFRDLQSSISKFATLLFGKNWKKQIIRKIRS